MNTRENRYRLVKTFFKTFKLLLYPKITDSLKRLIRFFPELYFGAFGIPQRNMSFQVELHFFEKEI